MMKIVVAIQLDGTSGELKNANKFLSFPPQKPKTHFTKKNLLKKNSGKLRKKCKISIKKIFDVI